MNNTKDLKRRIKSTINTSKITKAMEMVSAAKMRRAVKGVVHVRPYAHAAWSVLTNLSRAFKASESSFLEVRRVKRILIILVTSNRGLCGSYNAQIIKKIREELENPENLMVNRIGFKKIDPEVDKEHLKVDFVTVGKKGEKFLRKIDKNIIASFPQFTYYSLIEDIRPLAKIAMDGYLEKTYDKVVVAYTDYISTIKQKTRIRQILPISKIDLEKQIVEMDVMAKKYGFDDPDVEYKVEPSPVEVLDFIFPRLIEMQIYHALLESNASKESARMIAMRNATDAANDMRSIFTLAYNQVRQSKITQEISEISAGRAALEN
ncbi:MAG: ATP synthase F1 subunit gamma [bacterium]|nr:ATP synthase F1 subunit gamma [bacterium]